MSTSANALAKELSSLVTMLPDTASVRKDQDSETYTFKVTFNSNRGEPSCYVIVCIRREIVDFPFGKIGKGKGKFSPRQSAIGSPEELCGQCLTLVSTVETT